MTVSPAQLYRMKLIGELHGQYTQNELWFRSPTSGTASSVQAEMQGLNTELLTNIVPLFKAFSSQQWSAKTMLLVQMTARPGIFFDNVLTGGGIQTDDSLPSYCAGLLSLRTGLTGRSRVGRLYVPGVSENLSSNSRLEGNYLAILQNLGSALISRFGPTGTSGYGRVGVFSRLLGVTRNPGPPPYLTYLVSGWTQATTFIARNEVQTVRKRKLARGQ